MLPIEQYHRMQKRLVRWQHSRLKIVEKLHHGIILGFDWFQSINLKVDWVNYGFTFKNGFIAAGVPVHCNVKVELYSFKALINILHANRLKNSWFTSI